MMEQTRLVMHIIYLLFLCYFKNSISVGAHRYLCCSSYDTIKERPKPKLKSDFMSYELTHKSFLILPQHRKLLCKYTTNISQPIKRSYFVCDIYSVHFCLLGQHELHQKSQNCRSYRIADCVFNIEAVFKMNSEFLAEKAALESGVRKRRKRKLVQVNLNSV